MKESLGFRLTDFEVFKVKDFSERMRQIYAYVRPKLLRLSNDLAQQLAGKLHMELFAHVAKHTRQTVNPPGETWVAFGPSPRGYKRHGYLALCVSMAGLQARLVVKPEADQRPEMARQVRAGAPELARLMEGAPVARFDGWDFRALPRAAAVKKELFEELAESLANGGLDVGFGWSVRDSIKLERPELLDAFRELEPLYRILRRAARPAGQRAAD